MLVCKRLYLRVLCLAVASLLLNKSNAQDIGEKQLVQLESRAENFSEKIDKQTTKYLKKLKKQELKFAKKLAKKDSLAGQQMLNDINSQYAKLENKLTEQKNKVSRRVTEYLPTLDSTSTALKFIADNPLLQHTKEYASKVKNTLTQYQTLQQKIQGVADVKQIIKERKAQLTEMAKNHNLTKQLKKYNKQVYYYAAQINEYKEALKDPVKAEKLLVKTLMKIPKFKEFVEKSTINNLFPGSNNLPNISGLSPNLGSTTSYSGLQSRAGIIHSLQQRYSSSNSGSNLSTDIQNRLSQSQNSYNTLKAKAEPTNLDFKPNTQKTKSFKERLYFMTDIQFKKNTNYFPNSSKIGIDAGFKASDNANFGVGIAYQLGFGTGWRNIKLTNESLGIRTFFEYKTGNSLYVRAGAEFNYLLKNNNLNNLIYSQNWNQSILIGASKKVKFKGKNASIQVMYDFLYKQKLPIQSPFIYRISYQF